MTEEPFLLRQRVEHFERNDAEWNKQPDEVSKDWFAVQMGLVLGAWAVVLIVLLKFWPEIEKVLWS